MTSGSQTCTTTLQYTDIVPPPHNNQTNADFLLGTSTTVCDAYGAISPQLDFMLQLSLEGLFVLAGLLVGYWLLKRK